MKYSKIVESIISPFKIVTKKDCFEWAFFLWTDYQNVIHLFHKQKRRPYTRASSIIKLVVARYIILQVAS